MDDVTKYTRLMDAIESFSGDYRFLSNFWPAKISHDGIDYPSNEHFYVAMKTLDTRLRKEISEVATPGKVKRFGRNMEIREDWDDVRIKVMEVGLNEKFSDKNPELKQMLIDTGDAELIEGNKWNDTFWGVDARTGNGLNHLGILLMKIRRQLTESVNK